jgi:hypothetical protein
VSILNLADTGENFVQLSATCFLGSCPGTETSFTLAPRQSVLLEDVLGSSLGIPETGAAIEVFSRFPVSVSSRLYTPSHPDPTVGMYVPGLRPSEAGSPLILPSLSYSPAAGTGSRVNVGVYNASDVAQDVRIRLFRDTGELLGETGSALNPGFGVQFNDLFRMVGVTEAIPNAYCVVDADAFGGLHAYAAVIDNQSQDPIFVYGLQDPAVSP